MWIFVCLYGAPDGRDKLLIHPREIFGAVKINNDQVQVARVWYENLLHMNTVLQKALYVR